MTYLLDVNLLVALFDRRHVNHEAAHAGLLATFDGSLARSLDGTPLRDSIEVVGS